VPLKPDQPLSTWPEGGRARGERTRLPLCTVLMWVHPRLTVRRNFNHTNAAIAIDRPQHGAKIERN